ncbi:hypothetical protein F4677DRAFT_195419 [Hypoxylon crocopeplum]|nr:hypothetical protein F4677DRAFT_195419 [Hypoxylon crocopeplum]
MAEPTPPTPAVPPSKRPLTTLFLLIFAGFSAACTWLMRIEPVFHDVPPHFQSVIDAERFENGAPLLTRYTGIAAVDTVARFLVAAFLSGTARWDVGAHAQQAYFLAHWFAIVCVWNVEACRRRNSGRVVSFAALFALAYQLIGGAVIAPLYYAAYVLTSANDAYFFQGREVPAYYAASLLPAAVLGYLVPTVALWYVPWSSLETVQYLTALWQPAPLFVGLLVLLLSYLVPSSRSPSAVAKHADVKHLKRMYLFVGVVSTAAHLYTLYTCLTSSDNPQLSLSYVFLPSRETWKGSMALGLHYIFQVDFFGAYGASLVWLWLAVYDMLRILGKPSAKDFVQTAMGIAFITLIAGPGTTIVAVWHWREDRLVMIENGVRGTWKKPKAA